MARKPKGRANGEGSAYEYPKGSGKWFAAITIDGKVKRRRAGSQKEALELKRELEESRRAGVSLTKRQPTVKEWCESWVKTAPNLRPTTRADYARLLACYLYQYPIARRRLDALTPAEVQGWVNDLGQKVSGLTVRNIHARLRRALAVAVKQGYVPRNVALGVDMPKATPRAIVYLDYAQARRLLAALDGDRLALLYRLAINLGMREGELQGLTWQAIDLAAGQLRAATLMLAAKEPITAVSAILGHSSPAITARVYAHALEESKATAIAGLSAKLRKG